MQNQYTPKHDITKFISELTKQGLSPDEIIEKSKQQFTLPEDFWQKTKQILINAIKS